MTGQRACHNPLFSPNKNKFAEKAHTQGSGIPTPIFAAFKAPTPTPALVSASVLGPPGRYMDENLQKVITLALELFV